MNNEYVKVLGKSLSWEEIYNLTSLTEEDFSLYPHSSYDVLMRAYNNDQNEEEE